MRDSLPVLAPLILPYMAYVAYHHPSPYRNVLTIINLVVLCAVIGMFAHWWGGHETIILIQKIELSDAQRLAVRAIDLRPSPLDLLMRWLMAFYLYANSLQFLPRLGITPYP